MSDEPEEAIIELRKAAVLFTEVMDSLMSKATGYSSDELRIITKALRDCTMNLLTVVQMAKIREEG